MNSTLFYNKTSEPQTCGDHAYLINTDLSTTSMAYIGGFCAALAIGMTGLVRRKILFISLGILILAGLAQLGIYLYKFGSPIYIPGLKEYLINNQFINGALFLSVIGLISYYAQQVAYWIRDLFYYRLVNTIVVNSRNP